MSESYDNIFSFLHGFCAEVPLCGKVVCFYDFAGSNAEPMDLMLRHEFYQIIFTLEGFASLTIEGQQLEMQAGSILFINKNIPHANPTFVSSGYQFLVILFDVIEERLSERHKSNVEAMWGEEENQLFNMIFEHPYVYVYKSESCLQQVQSLNERMKDIYIGGYTIIRNCITNLLIQIMQTLYITIAPLPKTKMKPDLFFNPTSRVYDYIVEHCTEQISLSSISDDLGYSPRHLQRLIKRYYGVNLSDLLNHLRLVEAKKLLRDTTLSVNEICGRCGISNEAALCKLFKKIYGMSPREYRKLLKKDFSMPLLESQEFRNSVE